jgi:hypothetical protein
MNRIRLLKWTRQLGCFLVLFWITACSFPAAPEIVEKTPPPPTLSSTSMPVSSPATPTLTPRSRTKPSPPPSPGSPIETPTEPTSTATHTPTPIPTPTATATPPPSPTPSLPTPTVTATPIPPTTVAPTPIPSPTLAAAPQDIEDESQTTPVAYRFLPIGPAQPDLSQPCPGCPRAPGYITGRVVDAAGRPLPGVRLVCYNSWHRYPVVGTKGGGENDFPIIQAEATWYVEVLDEADQPLSPSVPVDYNPLEACWYRLDWRRVD